MIQIAFIFGVCAAFAAIVWMFPDWEGPKRLDNRTIVAVIIVAVGLVLAFSLLPSIH